MPRSSATNHELARIELLAGLPGETLAELGKRMERQEIKPGTVVVREGEPGDRFYVIAEGEVEVSRSGKHVAWLRRGDCFGEIALLRDIPRTATVTATKDSVLYALDKSAFVSAVTGHDPSARAADELVRGRLPDATIAS